MIDRITLWIDKHFYDLVSLAILAALTGVCIWFLYTHP